MKEAIPGFAKLANDKGIRRRQAAANPFVEKQRGYMKEFVWKKRKDNLQRKGEFGGDSDSFVTLARTIER